MEYCRHIWAGAAPIFTLHALIEFKVVYASWGDDDIFCTQQTLSYGRKVSSYNELYSLHPPVQAFTAKTRHVMSTKSNHPYSIRISTVNPT